MYMHSTLGSDLTDTSPLFEACRDLANASSLVELERQLNYWLPRCYAPSAWTIVCSALASDEPLFELKDQDELAGTGQLGSPVTIPLQLGSSMRGQ